MAPYITLKLPNDLIKEVDKLVGKHGYSSRPEVVKDALRGLLRKYPETNGQMLEKLPNAESEV